MIESVIVSIAVLGLALVSLLYVRLREVDRTLQLKRHRSGEAGVCDLLNYAAVVADGIVIGKNGGLIAGWEYTGDDNASTTDTQRDVVSVRVNQALARLGSGWMLHIDAVRLPAEVYSARGLSHFPDRVSAAIDEERRSFFGERGALYGSKFILCVSYLPLTGTVKRLSEIIYDAPKVDTLKDAANTLAIFQRELAALQSVRRTACPYCSKGSNGGW